MSSAWFVSAVIYLVVIASTDWDEQVRITVERQRVESQRLAEMQKELGDEDNLIDATDVEVDNEGKVSEVALLPLAGNDADDDALRKDAAVASTSMLPDESEHN